MYRGRTVGVVVPAYNEQEHVAAVLETIPTFVDRIYAVDDRSTDDTWQIIHTVAGAGDRVAPILDRSNRPSSQLYAQEEEPVVHESIADGGTVDTQRIVPIRHDVNRGAGAALRTGYLYALSDGIDIVVSMDADGQMDPNQLPRLLDPIVDDVADYAKGNRLASRNNRAGMPSFRLFGNWLLTQLTRLATGYWRIADPQNGYTAISFGALSRIGIEDIPDDHNYTNDVLVRLNACELRVADVAMPAVYDDEESTIRYRTFIPRTSATLLRGFIHRLRTRYGFDGVYIPICYTIGVLAMGIAFVIAVAAGLTSTLTWSTAVGGFLIGLGVFVFAVLLDARANASLEVPA